MGPGMCLDLCLKWLWVTAMFLYLYLSLSFLIKHARSSFVQWAVNGVYGMNVRPLDIMFSSSTESWYEERLTTLSNESQHSMSVMAVGRVLSLCLSPFVW